MSLDIKLPRNFNKRILNNEVVCLYLPEDDKNLETACQNRIICHYSSTYSPLHYLIIPMGQIVMPWESDPPLTAKYLTTRQYHI
jgi:hypothetical protein